MYCVRNENRSRGDRRLLGGGFSGRNMRGGGRRGGRPPIAHRLNALTTTRFFSVRHLFCSYSQPSVSGEFPNKPSSIVLPCHYYLFVLFCVILDQIVVCSKYFFIFSRVKKTKQNRKPPHSRIKKKLISFTFRVLYPATCDETRCFFFSPILNVRLKNYIKKKYCTPLIKGVFFFSPCTYHLNFRYMYYLRIRIVTIPTTVRYV